MASVDGRHDGMKVGMVAGIQGDTLPSYFGNDPSGATHRFEFSAGAIDTALMTDQSHRRCKDEGTKDLLRDLFMAQVRMFFKVYSDEESPSKVLQSFQLERFPVCVPSHTKIFGFMYICFFFTMTRGLVLVHFMHTLVWRELLALLQSLKNLSESSNNFASLNI